MVSKLLIDARDNGLLETEPVEVDRDEFLQMCKDSEADPCAVAKLTATPIVTRSTQNREDAGRTRRAKDQFRATVRMLIGNNELPPEAAAALVRGVRNKMLVDAVTSGDVKTAAEMTKQIATDQAIFGATKIEITTNAIANILDSEETEEFRFADGVTFSDLTPEIEEGKCINNDD